MELEELKEAFIKKVSTEKFPSSGDVIKMLDKASEQQIRSAWSYLISNKARKDTAHAWEETLVGELKPVKRMNVNSFKKYIRGGK